ncbi:hypothetical protein Q8A67_021587 [Cirrhinus molitorella]|uniref:Uncharacterized protein n=1 Tax=Cirrhinus molitorella TaxID=172907 RepID=A0AA88TC40_9TELE|nr:hypothetical protein Q8A67_021587 [Cirrhinus molitorella]
MKRSRRNDMMNTVRREARQMRSAEAARYRTSNSPGARDPPERDAPPPPPKPGSPRGPPLPLALRLVSV